MNVTSTPSLSPVPVAAPVSHHIRRTVSLALPVMLSRAGLVIMIAIDTFLCRGSGVELAYFGGSVQPQTLLQAVGIGLLIGTIVLCAQADGAGERERCGGIWRLSMIVAGILGLLQALILVSGDALMRLLGQPADIAAGSGFALQMFAIGMPGLMLFSACNLVLEGISRPWPGTIIMLVANIANFALAWPLTNGTIDLSPIFGTQISGASGAALATSITRWLMFLCALTVVFRQRDRAVYGIKFLGGWQRGELKRLLWLGLPLALAIALESSCFGSMIVMAGWLGTSSLAAMHSAINLTSLVYMLTIGIATAAAIRVANAIGRGSWRDAARAGWVAFGMEFAVMASVSITLSLLVKPLARAYSHDDAVLVLLIPVFTVTALMIVIDGLQGVLMGSLRGASDTTLPTIIYGLSFWAVGVPIGYIWGYRHGMGPMALMTALATSLCIAMTLLIWRFHALTRKRIRAEAQG
ncbi:MAG: MATE family efflux transporter [Rhodospirillaceae bacterium]|nr:MAG: MATE family efflux transporter [Rhodospirillaceae bacterium]